MRDDKIMIVPVKKDGELVYHEGVKRKSQIIYQVCDSSEAHNGARGLSGELFVLLDSSIRVNGQYWADYETKKVVSVRD